MAELEIKAESELLIRGILFLKEFRKALQRSGDESELLSGYYYYQKEQINANVKYEFRYDG